MLVLYHRNRGTTFGRFHILTGEPFLIDSDAELFMYLISQGIRLRLMKRSASELDLTIHNRACREKYMKKVIYF